jgi:hypothetical protein
LILPILDETFDRIAWFYTQTAAIRTHHGPSALRRNRGQAASHFLIFFNLFFDVLCFSKTFQLFWLYMALGWRHQQKGGL